MIGKVHFLNEQEKIDYVNACDNAFEKELDDAVNEICCCKKIKFITLSGPTCSGKTTASRKLSYELEERNKTVRHVSLDDFFRDRGELELEAIAENRSIDLDSEKALDIPCLSKFMHAVQNGMEAKLPHFNFNLGIRDRYDNFILGENDIVIFEGIQAIYPIFTSMFEHDDIISMLICVNEPITFSGFTLHAREIRLWRRLVRDYKFRGATGEFTFMLWEGVTENEDKNIIPYMDDADIKINSTLGYEPSMLKSSLEKVLSEISSDSKYYNKSREILGKLQYVEPISEKYLPKNSLYKEFI